MTRLLTINDSGIYCKEGDFYIDPWKPVDTAFITHAHADHAVNGHNHYYSTNSSIPILKHRLGKINIDGLDYRETKILKGIEVSFHPAGHILGSAQVRVDNGTEVWVVSGDYKRQIDPTCERFEVVECDTFITEATFALPIYRWPRTELVVEGIYNWVQLNKKEKKASILFCYALGKSQRLLMELKRFFDEPIFIHGALDSLVKIYRDAGLDLLPTIKATEQPKGFDFSDKIVLAPPSAFRTKWLRRFGDANTAFVSGWMNVRAQKTQGGYDKGFALSDHADWYDLIRTIKETGAKTVLVTHGRSDILARYLNEEMAINASILNTQYSENDD